MAKAYSRKFTTDLTELLEPAFPCCFVCAGHAVKDFCIGSQGSDWTIASEAFCVLEQHSGNLMHAIRAAGNNSTQPCHLCSTVLQTRAVQAIHLCGDMLYILQDTTVTGLFS